MRDFFNKHCSKEHLERYGLLIPIVGTISVFFGIIYQYTALSYGELSFFSWTQTVNDGIKMVPIVISMFIGGYYGFNLVALVSKLSLYKRGLLSDHVLTSLVLYGMWVIFLLYVGWFSNFFKDNLSGTIAIGFTFLVITTLYILLLHSLFAFFDPSIRILQEWIKLHKVPYLVPLLLVTGVYFTGVFLKSGISTIDSHNCVMYEGRLYGIKYLNDKYIFSEKGFIFENKDRTFLKNINSCEAANDSLIRYIKKDGKCIPIRSFDDKQFQYIETASGFIKNNGYDLYFSGACVSDSPNKR